MYNTGLETLQCLLTHNEYNYHSIVLKRLLIIIINTNNGWRNNENRQIVSNKPVFENGLSGIIMWAINIP